METVGKFVFGSLGATLLLMSVAACTSGVGPERETTIQPTAGSSPGQPESTTSLPDSLPAPTDVGPDEELLFHIGSQKGSASYGPVPTKQRTVVYLRCAGDGAVTFEMKAVSSFSVPCEQDGVLHGTRNVFDTWHVKDPVFSVQSAPGQIWSIGIYSEPVK